MPKEEEEEEAEEEEEEEETEGFKRRISLTNHLLDRLFIKLMINLAHLVFFLTKAMTTTPIVKTEVTSELNPSSTFI